MNAPAEAFHPRRHFPSTLPGVPSVDDSDARSDLEESLPPRYAYVLGQDAGRLRMTATGAWPDDDMRRGYNDGLKQAVQQGSDPVRRLVALRVRAFVEGLPFSSAITATFLQDIDVPVCPVSGAVLSSGTDGPAERTITRLDPRAGYVPGNVCVVARRIHELKAQHSLEDFQAQGVWMVKQHPSDLTAGQAHELSAIEALRLAALVSAPTGWFSGRVGTLPPLATAPGLWGTPTVNVAVAHVLRAKSTAQPDTERLLDRWYGADSHTRATSEQLVRHLREEFRQGTHACDVWLDPAATSSLEALLQALLRAAASSAPAQQEAAMAAVRAAAAPLHLYVPSPVN